MGSLIARNFQVAFVQLDIGSSDSNAMQAWKRLEDHRAIIIRDLIRHGTAGADGVHQLNCRVAGLLHVAVDGDKQSQCDRRWSLPLTDLG